MTAEEELRELQRYFRELILHRAAEFKVPTPHFLPELGLDIIGRAEAEWFDVPGMYGGFSYTLNRTDEHLLLHCESWCRVVGGSGQAHNITKQGVQLVDSGFV